MVEPGYYTVADLRELGWTRGLIERYWGPPDTYLPVDHWANWIGKKAWRIEWVEQIEMTQGFEAGFLRSARIRRLPVEKVEEVIDRIYRTRENGTSSTEIIQRDSERLLNAQLAQAADFLGEARRRGYRTPHKC